MKTTANETRYYAEKYKEMPKSCTQYKVKLRLAQDEYILMYIWFLIYTEK